MRKCQAWSNIQYVQDHFHVAPAYARSGVRNCTKIQLCLVLRKERYGCSGGGEVAAGTSSITDRSLLARDTDFMDYDMPDGLHAALPMPPRPHPETVASLAPLMDDMLIDGDGDADLIAVTHAENTVRVFLAQTDCDNLKSTSCCAGGTEWNGTACVACSKGTYGVGVGTAAMVLIQ